MKASTKWWLLAGAAAGAAYLYMCAVTGAGNPITQFFAPKPRPVPASKPQTVVN